MPININSLLVKSNLNKRIWAKNMRLRPHVRKRLLQIAFDFFDELEVPWSALKDITFTGSLANYNWSKNSDIDLHLIVDFDKVDENIDLVKMFFNARKNLWNENHNIKIYGFDVEVYVQNADEPHYSTGVYSILNDSWIVKPQPSKPFIDKAVIERKVKFIMSLIDDVCKLAKKGDWRKVIEEAEKLSEKIKKMRSCGLEKGGEFSVENLSFKILRRNGYMKKLYDIKLHAYDKLMSI